MDFDKLLQFGFRRVYPVLLTSFMILASSADIVKYESTSFGKSIYVGQK